MYFADTPARAFPGYRIGVRYDRVSPRAATRGPVERASIKLKNNFSRLPFPLTFHYLYIRQDASRDKKYLKQVSIFYSPLAFHYLFRRKDTSQHKNQASLFFCFRLSLSLHTAKIGVGSAKSSSKLGFLLSPFTIFAPRLCGGAEVPHLVGSHERDTILWINNILRFCLKMR